MGTGGTVWLLINKGGGALCLLMAQDLSRVLHSG